jgi:SAM-dependent methyltransferase
MGVKLLRKKPKNFILSLIYRLQKLLPFSSRLKLKLFLDLEWIFDRLSHEMSFKLQSPATHPVRQFSKKFILEHIDEKSNVLDLGCNLGDISFIIAQKANKVVGVDYNEVAISLARNRYKKDNLDFYFGEAIEYLKHSNERFDILILSHILEHLDHPKDFLETFKDSFDKIYIEVPDFDRNYLNHYRKELDLKLLYSDDDHISEFDRDELKEILKSCNMEIICDEYRYGVMKLWCKHKK